MDRLILDTGVLIAVERGSIRTPGDEDDLAIAAITASELRVGVELADDVRRPARAHAVEAILATFEVLDFDLAASRHHARLAAETSRTGRPRGGERPAHRRDGKRNRSHHHHDRYLGLHRPPRGDRAHRHLDAT